MKIFGLLWFSLSIFLSAKVLEFDLLKMETQSKKHPRVLIISGIQGDEPGGFNATNFFLKHYKIIQGEVWVIPNLNKHSILQNHRGIYGDMNRKFQALNSSDEEYSIIQKIKSLILDPQIDVIYHLHDGSGFYRASYVSPLLNPNRWGNCSIIDQENVKGSYYENLLFLSEKIIANINQNVLKDLHTYRVRNTYTATQDKEMEKSLTYFAVINNKTALANEVSKELPLNERVYYHLLGIEGMLKEVGVKFQRDFDLKPKIITSLLYPKDSYFIIEDKIRLPLMGLKSKITYFPLPKKDISQIKLNSDQYILGLLEKKKDIAIKYGNRTLTTVSPLYVDFSNALKEVEIEVDGKVRNVQMGEIIKVRKYFQVNLDEPNFRVNVIGYQGKKENENFEKVRLQDLIKRYSIDRMEKKYRIEFYDLKNRFLGMIVVDFI